MHRHPPPRARAPHPGPLLCRACRVGKVDWGRDTSSRKLSFAESVFEHPHLRTRGASRAVSDQRSANHDRIRTVTPTRISLEVHEGGRDQRRNVDPPHEALVGDGPPCRLSLGWSPLIERRVGQYSRITHCTWCSAVLLSRLCALGSVYA
ncbi:hypothetical protein FA95DRAFT_122832 [Auriscalpium vulgare]|uniref:Uncharacterized protein n=1 Tax=Auriscalpium vulgare TaxID=40419 RepID=A0ACB8RMN3_9AGAM|nr:hypothetical protein FA95DRAFT_122832 [Auriscalpium vulgare]